jgi:hypothetical protein
MRDLTHNEVQMVGGGHGVCTPENSYGGVTNPSSVGRDLINFYEGLVMFTSHVFERVAKAKDRAK